MLIQVISRMQVTHGTDADDKIEIPAVDGKMVLASRLFVMYREWIERRVAEEKGKVTVIDATEGGALKKGMSVMKLEDVFKHWTML